MSQLIIRLKVSQELLSPWEQLNFGKSSCYRPISSQTKKFIDCKKSFKQTLWTLENCFLTFVLFYQMRKFAQNLFFTGKIAFLFKKFCFQQPLRSWKNDLITSIVNNRLVLDPQKPSLEVCQARIYEKKQVKIFSLLENCPFFEKKCVFNNLSVPEETILVFPQWLSN